MVHQYATERGRKKRGGESQTDKDRQRQSYTETKPTEVLRPVNRKGHMYYITGKKAESARDTSHFMFEEDVKKMKVNKPGRQ